MMTREDAFRVAFRALMTDPAAIDRWDRYQIGRLLRQQQMAMYANAYVTGLGGLLMSLKAAR